MARQILFVQGAGDGTHDGWDNRLVASLTRELGDGYDVLYPRMPDEADPQYDAWKAALVEAFATLDEGAVLIGHSTGGTVLIHTLAEQPTLPTPRAIVLIAAPFIGEGGWPSEDMPARVDFAERLPAGVPVLLYHGTADDTAPVAHVQLYANLLPHARVRALAGRDHQLNNDLGEVARDIMALSTPTD